MKYLFLLLLVCGMGCKTKEVDKKAEGEKVMETSREWSKMASAGDVEKTLTYWADNAILISAEQPVLTGKTAIRQMVEESFKIPGFKISWEPVSVEVSDNVDMAYLIENSQISYPDSTGKVNTYNNKVVTIWRKQTDGSWKNVVDIATPMSK